MLIERNGKKMKSYYDYNQEQDKKEVLSIIVKALGSEGFRCSLRNEEDLLNDEVQLYNSTRFKLTLHNREHLCLSVKSECRVDGAFMSELESLQRVVLKLKFALPLF